MAVLLSTICHLLTSASIIILEYNNHYLASHYYRNWLRSEKEQPCLICTFWFHRRCYINWVQTIYWLKLQNFPWRWNHERVTHSCARPLLLDWDIVLHVTTLLFLSCFLLNCLSSFTTELRSSTVYNSKCDLRLAWKTWNW